MYELDQTIEIFGGDLDKSACFLVTWMDSTHCLVLLVEVVDVAVEDFHKQLNRYSGVHARICYSKCTLQALEYTFAIAVKLKNVSKLPPKQRDYLPLSYLPRL